MGVFWTLYKKGAQPCLAQPSMQSTGMQLEARTSSTKIAGMRHSETKRIDLGVSAFDPMCLQFKGLGRSKQGVKATNL